MDEPLASLDAKLKVEMRNRIKVLQRELGITTVYVTHDQEEAMTLADKIAVMHNGHVSQFGTPTEIYHDPANEFIAEFIGSPSMNLLTVVRDDDDPQRVRAKTDPESFALMLDSKFSDSRKQIDRFDLGIRPQYFQVHTEPTDEGVSCVVEVTQPTGDEQLLTVYTGSGLDGSGIELTVKTASERSIDHGQQLWLTVDPDEVYRFDPETGERIKPEGETPEAPLENTMIDAQ
jgi:multiple sugar transport system ATP-binding protein